MRFIKDLLRLRPWSPEKPPTAIATAPPPSDDAKDAMDVTQALRDAENAVSDLIAYELSRKLGEDWIEKCGIDPSVLKGWRSKKKTEDSQQQGCTP